MKLEILEYQKDRTVYLCDEIDSATVTDVQSAIQDIIDKDEDVFEKNKVTLSQLGDDYTRLYENGNIFPPIQLVVNSTGGSVNDGLSLYDFIHYLNYNTGHKVNITCQGTVASMATIVILSSPDIRATKNTSFLLHSMSDLAYGKIQDMEDNLAECKRLNELMSNIYLENSNLTKEILDNIDKSKKDWWFGTEKALELGLINEIV